MIQIAGNQIIQLRQVSSSYQAKSALNMSKELLQEEFQEDELPKSGSVRTSEGIVKIEREETEGEYIFTLALTTKAGSQYTDTVSIAIPEPEADGTAPEIEDDEAEEEIEETENNENQGQKTEDETESATELKIDELEIKEDKQETEASSADDE